MKNIIKRILRSKGYTIFKDRNLTLTSTELFLLRKNISSDDVKIIDTNTIFLKRIGITVNISQHNYLLDGYYLLLKLKEKVDAQFTQEGLNLIVDVYGCKAYINTWEELIIMNEIYIEGVYNVYTNSDEKHILVDIGMNVGLTTLFFSTKESILKTYSFEPFKETYENALKNFDLNPKFKNKINAYNYGIGSEDKSTSWFYNPDYKGSMGINGMPAHVNLDSNKNQTIDVTIKSISSEIRKIKEEHPKNPIILKIDCEGSEYEILRKMSEEKLFSDISILMIEWHVHGPAELLGYLKENEYTVFSYSEHDSVIGMLYAVKKS